MEGHISLNDVLMSFTSLIHSQQDEEHDPTPTEYFAAVSTTLAHSIEQASQSQGSTAGNSMNEYVVNCMKILEAVIPNSSLPIVRNQFRSLSSTMMQLINSSQENLPVLKSAIKLLGTLLSVQEYSDSFWANVQPLQCINTILALIEHNDLKLRKLAQDQLISLLKQHSMQKAKAVRNYLADYCIGVIQACTRSSYKRSLYIILFLESASCYLPTATSDNDENDKLLVLFREMLNLQSCKQPVLTAAVIRSIDAFFQSPSYPLSTTSTNSLLTLLVSTKLQTDDMESHSYRYLALASGFLRLNGMDELSAIRIMKKVLKAVLTGFGARFVQIHDAAATALKRIIGEGIPYHVQKQMIQQAMTFAEAEIYGDEDNNNWKEKAVPFINQLIKTLESLLVAKYKSAWVHIVNVVKKMFETIRQNNDASVLLLSNLVSQLAQIYESAETGAVILDTSIHLVIGETLGIAIRTFGFASFINVVPFRNRSSQTPAFVVIDKEREWLLPLFHNNLKSVSCSLFDYKTIVLNAVEKCREAVLTPSKYSLNAVKVKFLKTMAIQLYSLFPDFCQYGANDLSHALPILIPQMVNAFKNKQNNDNNNNEEEDVHYNPHVIGYLLQGLTNIANMTNVKSGGRAYSSAGYNVIDDSNDGMNASSYFSQFKMPKVVDSNTEEMVMLPYEYANLFSRIQTPDYVAISTLTRQTLPALLNYVDNVPLGDANFQLGVKCIASWVSIAAPNVAANVIKRLSKMLLSATTARDSMKTSLIVSTAMNAQTEAIARWMSIIMAIIPYTPSNLVHILYRTIKPMLPVKESIASQKRAYSILESLLEIHGATLFESEAKQSILEVISNSLMSCHVSARNMRLRCMESLLKQMASGAPTNNNNNNYFGGLKEGGDMEVSAKEDCQADLLGAADMVLAEVLVCQKDNNTKTRESAKNLLNTFISHVQWNDMFTRLCSALVSDTAVMRSSSIISICLLFTKYRYNHNVHMSLINLLDTVLLLLQEETPEQTRAVLMYLKVTISVLPQHMLAQTIAARVIDAFCNQLGALKSKFSNLMKKLMRKLLSKMGEETLRPMVPKEDLPLLDYLVRIERRRERKLEAKKENEGSGETDSDDNSDEDSDFDDEEDLTAEHEDEDDVDDNISMMVSSDRGNKKRISRNKLSQQKVQPREDHRISDRPRAIRAEDLKDDSLPNSLTELIENQNDPRNSNREMSSNNKRTVEVRGRKAKRMQSESNNDNSNTSNNNVSREEDNEDYKVVVNRNGMVVIQDTSEVDNDNINKRSKGTSSLDMNADKEGDTGAEAGETGQINSIYGSQQGAQKKKKRVDVVPGEEYKSAKAGGDVWKKGSLQPFAFIPLDGKNIMAKGKQRENVSQFDGVFGLGNRAGGRKAQQAKVKDAKSHVVVGNRNQRQARRKHAFKVAEKAAAQKTQRSKSSKR